MQVEILLCVMKMSAMCFVSRKESVFPVQTHLDMENNYIYNVEAPVNNDQGANKSYIDDNFLKLSGGNITGPVSKSRQPGVHGNSLLNWDEMKLSFGWQNLNQLTKWPFQTILGPLQLQTRFIVIAQMKPY